MQLVLHTLHLQCLSKQVVSLAVLFAAAAAGVSAAACGGGGGLHRGASTQAQARAGDTCGGGSTTQGKCVWWRACCPQLLCSVYFTSRHRLWVQQRKTYMLQQLGAVDTQLVWAAAAAPNYIPTSAVFSFIVSTGRLSYATIMAAPHCCLHTPLCLPLVPPPPHPQWLEIKPGDDEKTIARKKKLLKSYKSKKRFQQMDIKQKERADSWQSFLKGKGSKPKQGGCWGREGQETNME